MTIAWRVGRVLAAALALACPPGRALGQGQPNESTSDADDIDFARAMQELDEDSSELQIYGFADFTFSWFPMDRESGWFHYYFSKYPTFAIGNINLYLAKRIASRWNSLIEFRLLYLPNGSERADLTDGSYEVTDTTVTDPQDKAETLRWGGISIERAYVEYELDPLLHIRAGQFITPYGLWNIDHGSPVLLTIRRPFLIGLLLFPKSQTGLELYGARAFGDKTLSYHLTLSNGRGPIDSYLDQDDNKAVGGRLMLEAPWLDDFRLGASAYTGTFTRRSRHYALDGGVVAVDSLAERYRELSLAADLRLSSGPFLLNAELLSTQRAYDDRARPPSVLGLGGVEPDILRWGAYAQLGYRLPANVIPYIQAELVRFGAKALPTGVTGVLGVNYRPTPTVTLKLQVQQAYLPGSTFDLLPDEVATLIESQAAWSF